VSQTQAEACEAYRAAWVRWDWAAALFRADALNACGYIDACNAFNAARVELDRVIQSEAA